MTVIGQHLFEHFFFAEHFPAPKFKTPDKDLALITNQIHNLSEPSLVKHHPISEQEIPVDENYISVRITSYLLPSNRLWTALLEGKILFPEKAFSSSKLSSVVSRLELVENRLDQIDNCIHQNDYCLDKSTITLIQSTPVLTSFRLILPPISPPWNRNWTRDLTHFQTS
jgi:hypothetical protein